MLQVAMVDKAVASALREKMIVHIRFARDVNADNTFVRIREAQSSLHKSQGMYEVLKGLDLLENADVIGEDLDRTAEKVDEVLEEKRRKDLPRWRP